MDPSGATGVVLTLPTTGIRKDEDEDELSTTKSFVNRKDIVAIYVYFYLVPFFYSLKKRINME